jgi:hypothetical protein
MKVNMEVVTRGVTRIFHFNLSPMHGDQGSTQILTWHHGAMSQIIRQLMKLGTMPTRHVPVV